MQPWQHSTEHTPESGCEDHGAEQFSLEGSVSQRSADAVGSVFFEGSRTTFGTQCRPHHTDKMQQLGNANPNAK